MLRSEVLFLLVWAASGQGLAQRAYLKASNTDPDDSFGGALAMSGSTIVVGAWGEDGADTGVDGVQGDNSAVLAGAAYVFVRNGPVWSQQAYLKASNTEANDRFGIAVSISGDTLVVGAEWEYGGTTGVNGDDSDNSAPLAGAAYVFVRDGTTWSQQAYLKASNTELVEFFGCSVAVSGDTILVGARGEDSGATGVGGDQGDNSVHGSGAAYVFVRDGTTWSQQAYLKASNTGVQDTFGTSVALCGDLAVVGAPRESSNATGVDGDQGNDDATDSGAAYVFRRSGTTWSQEAYLKASNTGAHDAFGSNVCVSGNTVLVGAGSEAGGSAGVNGDDNDLVGLSGAAYVFAYDGSAWSQQAYLKASNPEYFDKFGAAIGLSGDMPVVGAYEEDSNATGVGGDDANNDAASSGAAYVFCREGTTWEQQAYVKGSNPGEGDRFGWAVALSGESIAVGAPGEDSSAVGVGGNQASNAAANSGAVYVLSPARAIVTFRNAGPNPASYVADAIVVGSTFTASVDNNLPAQAGSLLLAFESSSSFALAGGQRVLCIDTTGAGELFTGSGLAPVSSSAGVDGYALEVPGVPALVGYSFCSQAIQFGSPPFVLSNAQDFTIGAF